MDFQVIELTPPAAPASGATITLFDSTSFMWPGALSMIGAGRLVVQFCALSHASATNGLKAYTSADKGANWDATSMSVVGTVSALPATVPVCTTDTATYDIFIKNERDFKLTYENSANSLTSWRVVMKLTCGDVHVGTP